MRSIMPKANFIGREQELKALRLLNEKPSASLVAITGRRRVGKSRLIEAFSESCTTYKFQGLPPTKKTTAKAQREVFAKALAEQFNLPALKADDWTDLFSGLAKGCVSGKIIIVFDEISWMGSKDPDFLGKLKNVWDEKLQKNQELILILCGSVSQWIEKNVLSSAGFLGRPSLIIRLKPLSLTECHAFLKRQKFNRSAYEKLQLLAITGGIPRYLEEVQGSLGTEENISRLCFNDSGILSQEFEYIFNDLFARKAPLYKRIVSRLVKGPATFAKISEDLGLGKGSYLLDTLDDLAKAGFVSRDYTLKIKEKKLAKASQYRLSDNYTRFYLKYIEPNKHAIEIGNFHDNTLTALPGLDTIFGLQVENLVLNNRFLIHQALGLLPKDIICNNPYFQQKTQSHEACQFDYLIQTKFNTLFACEIRFTRDEIKPAIIEEMTKKINKLKLPRNFCVFPVLIHVGNVSEKVLEAEYFAYVIDFARYC